MLDEPAATYRFERFVVDSLDQQRRWRVNLAIPARAGKTPSPVLYALDGNAVAMVLDQRLLAELAARKAPPVLVLIGYDNDLRIDSGAYPRLHRVDRPCRRRERHDPGRRRRRCGFP